jgi:hypothetical protein
VADLWGFCRDCYYADVCRGGCTWTSHSLLGRPGNNPYCHYRVLQLQQQGVRERVVKRREASPESFGVGEFELVAERIPAGEQAPAEVLQRTPARNDLVQLTRRSSGSPLTRDGRIPSTLEICRACDQYIWPGETTCPHCGANLAESSEAYERQRQYREDLVAEVMRLIQAIGTPAPNSPALIS